MVLEGLEKKLIPGIANIKIKEVYDQFGTKLNLIPRGFQTIVNFNFVGKVPTKINGLSTLKDWNFNPNSISLAKHEDIRLSQPDFLLKGMNKAILIFIKNEFIKNDSLSRTKLVNILMSNYDAKDSNEAKKVINL